MAYITNNDAMETNTTSTVSIKIANFLKVVGIAFVQSQEARARRHVANYITKSYRPF